MKISIVNGRPAVYTDGGAPLLTDITCGVRYLSGEETVTRYEQGEWTLLEVDGGYVASCGGAELIFGSEGDGFTVRTIYTNAGEDIPDCEDLIALSGKAPCKIHKLVGADVRNSNGNRTNEMLTGVYTIDFAKDGQYEQLCGDFGAFTTDEGQKYIAGFITADEFFSGVYVNRDGTVEATAFTEHHTVRRGEVLTSDVFCFIPVNDPVRELCDFCDISAKYMDEKPRLNFDVPSGFCTWYYYLGEITDGIIMRSAEEMAQNREKLPVKYVQIDDGWQKCYGQWEENDKFGAGMKACADKIRSEGFLPGLWFAPLWARIAQVAKDHPEYFARDRRTGEQTICFDYSVEGTCTFMKEVFRRATYDWGFKYLKLDLMTTCLGDYVYSEEGFNSLKNYKKCMSLIRDSVPDDTFLLACTAPFLPSVGIVDGVRSSCDIGSDWDSVKEVMNRTLKRYYYHKCFFLNDADCLIIRKSENEDEECQRLCTRTDEEIRSYISATAASGGILMFSDKLSLLSEEQIETLSYLFPQNTDAALPLDMFDNVIPCVLDCGVKGNVRTVILVNWYDEDKLLSVDADDCHVYEFWSREYRGVADGKYTVSLKPHCCEVLHIVKADAPCVVGCENSLIPQTVCAVEDGMMKLTFMKRGERIVIAASNAVSGTCDVTKNADGTFTVQQTGDEMTVTVDVR